MRKSFLMYTLCAGVAYNSHAMFWLIDFKYGGVIILLAFLSDDYQIVVYIRMTIIDGFQLFCCVCTDGLNYQEKEDIYARSYMYGQALYRTMSSEVIARIAVFSM